MRPVRGRAVGVAQPMTLSAAPPFSLRESLKSGQTFRWREGTPPAHLSPPAAVAPQIVGPGAWLSGIVGSRLYFVRQTGGGVEFYGWPGDGHGALTDYLRLGDAPEGKRSGFVIDEFTARAYARYGGVRVLRQEPWETMVSFMISATNSVANIERTVARLADSYGRRVTVDEPFFGGGYRAFPTPESLARADEDELRRATSMGFRAPYVIGAARRIVDEGIELTEFRSRAYDETIEFLMSFDGIGEKVADCVALFSLDKPEAFPVDRWIKRVMERVYFRGRRKTYAEIKARAWRLWGNDAGHANQLIFHQARVDGVLA